MSMSVPPECGICNAVVAAYNQPCSVAINVHIRLDACTFSARCREMHAFLLLVCENNDYALDVLTVMVLLYTLVLLSTYAAYTACLDGTACGLFNDIAVLSFVAAYNLCFVLVCRSYELDSALSSFAFLFLCAASLFYRLKTVPDVYVSLRVDAYDADAAPSSEAEAKCTYTPHDTECGVSAMENGASETRVLNTE